MGRAFSLSLVAHAAFLISFLLLSATRQPLKIPEIPRPVRLVTYLEPTPAAQQRSRAQPVSEAAATRAAPATPRATQPVVVAAPAPAAVAPPAPLAAPPSAIPAPESEQPARRDLTPPTETRVALGERLARRLSATPPVEIRPDGAAPQIASLPSFEPAAVVDRPIPAAPADRPLPAALDTTALSPGGVTPVGYFPHAWYLGVLKEKVYARWSPPSEFFQSKHPAVALVSFRIDRAGRLGRITLKERSGFARFDQSALAAVQNLGQVPALPEQYGEESLDVVIRFQNQK